MMLVNPATDDDRAGGITDEYLDDLDRGRPSDVVVLDLRLREVEAFAVIREVAGAERSDRPSRALAVRCLAARVSSRYRVRVGAEFSTTAPSPLALRNDELRRALAFSEYLEWRIDDLNRTGDALGLL